MNGDGKKSYDHSHDNAEHEIAACSVSSISVTPSSPQKLSPHTIDVNRKVSAVKTSPPKLA
jgi:hypothetical protein